MSIAANPAKKAINISLSPDVIADAKRLGINISQTCDSHLREAIRLESERQWKTEHADFIVAYNELVEAEGPVLAEWRTF